ISRLWSCRANRSGGPRRRGGARRFGPYLSRRRAASSLLSPLLSEASCRPTTSGGEACHEACCVVSDISASPAGGAQVEDIPSLGTIRTRGGCSYRRGGSPFIAREPHRPRTANPTHKAAHPVQCRSTAPGAKGPGRKCPFKRATLPKRQPPVD